MKLYPKKIKAAILVKQNSPLVIDEISFPEKLFKGQVLVKIFYSGVCGSQLGEITGIKGKDKYLPHLLGHEAVGEVVDFGNKVTKVKKGDKVLFKCFKLTIIDEAHSSQAGKAAGQVRQAQA